MDKHERTKSIGLKNMRKRNFAQAADDFTRVVNALTPQTDAEYVLKCVCLLNRSSCYTQLAQYDAALADALSVVRLYGAARPPERQAALTPAALAADPLTEVLHLAYVRRGECFEAQRRFLDALQEYSQSTLLVRSGEGARAQRRLLDALRIPALDAGDADYAPFAAVVAHILSADALIAALTALAAHLSAALAPAAVERLCAAECTNALYGALQLHIDSALIVDMALQCLARAAQRGLVTVWNGFPVIASAMAHWERDARVVGAAVALIALSPRDLFAFYAREHFIPRVAAALALPIAPDEADAAFFALDAMCGAPRALVELASADIVDRIFERRSPAALRLLGRVAVLPACAARAAALGAGDWVAGVLSDSAATADAVAPAALVLAGLLAADGALSSAAFDSLVPHVRRLSRSAEVVGLSFAAFALAIDHAPAKVREHKLVPLASVLLSLHIGSEDAAQNVLAFLYECARAGFADELRAHSAVLPTAMRALSAFPRNRSIAERGVALARLLGHPRADELTAAARVALGGSPFLDALAE